MTEGERIARRAARDRAKARRTRAKAARAWLQAVRDACFDLPPERDDAHWVRAWPDERMGVRVPVDALREQVRTHRPASLARSVDDLAVLEEFARRVVMLGEAPAQAASTLGLPPERGVWLTRYSAQYAAARERVIAGGGVTREHLLRETAGIIMDNARLGAVVQGELLRTCVDPQVLARVSDSVQDRVGLRAPTRTEETKRVEIGAQSLAVIERMLGTLARAEAVDVSDGAHDAQVLALPSPTNAPL